MKTRSDHLKPNKLNLAFLWLPVFFLGWNIFIYGPVILYAGNILEFDVGLPTILKYYFLPGVMWLLLLFGIGLVLSKKHISLYVSLLGTMGILLWIQGNILVWRYGLLDGRGIDWKKDIWRGWFDGLSWILLLIIGLGFYKKIYKMVLSVIIAVLALQAVFLLVLSIQHPEIWKGKGRFSSRRAPPDEIHQFSGHTNVIHVILDGFQSDLFHDILKENLSYYARALSGFTFFKEATGAFATTYMSIPAILSGQSYKNDVPMPEFVKRTLEGRTVPNILYENGYDVDLVMIGSLYAHGRFSKCYFIPRLYGVTTFQHELGQAALLMDLVLFRLTPHFIKQRVYNNQRWFLQKLFTREKGLEYVQLSHQAFFDDFIEHVSVERDKPVYKLIHLATTHPPLVMNEDCQFAGQVLPFTRENFIIQDRCALKQVIKFFNELKALGIYDSSFIILQADTGVGMPVAAKHARQEVDPQDFTGRRKFLTVAGVASPLLAMKPPDREGPLMISNAQVMLTDIPATVSSVLKLNETFPGRSVFEVDPSEVRPRIYSDYQWKEKNWQDDYLERLEEYRIEGSVFDQNSWRLSQVYFPPGQRTPYDWGAAIRFGKAGNSQPYQIRGWSEPEDGFTWTNGQSASLNIPITALTQPSVTVQATLSAMIVPGKVDWQTVHILVNGQKAGEWIITKSEVQEQTLDVPKRFFDNLTQVAIAFEIPDAVSPAEIGISKDQRRLGIALHTIIFNPSPRQKINIR